MVAMVSGTVWCPMEIIPSWSVCQINPRSYHSMAMEDSDSSGTQSEFTTTFCILKRPYLQGLKYIYHTEK